MNAIYYRIILTILVLLLMPTAGDAFDTSRFEAYTYQQFRDYWYAGRGEISRYSLKQSRYGELHDGDAVLVFVTEMDGRHGADHPGGSNAHSGNGLLATPR